MKTFVFLVLLGTVALADDSIDLELAGPCDVEACQLPDCRCFSNDIPGGLEARDTPQFVTLTFDDAVTVAAMPNYREIIFNRRNSNNCPAGATFYVSHEWTDYSVVNELYNNGFEIALHSISHRIPQTFWMQATYENMKEEIADQREQISRFANIPLNAIQGVRLPFLQLNGNTSYQIIKDFNLGYDCTWPTVRNSPTLWPYTLDYASGQDCFIGPCPTASLPGVWVQPMVTWIDNAGFPCAMADSCSDPPDPEDTDAWFNFIVQNFERHYLGNRAPFGLYFHEAYLRGWPEVKKALIKFVDMVTNMQDVFLVNSNEVLNWVKAPVPINEYKSQSCRFWLPSSCIPSFCERVAEHNDWSYYFTICGTCPRVYPWVGNPLGA